MPRINTHGGGCCGVHHYSGFTHWNGDPAFDAESIERDLTAYPLRNEARSRGKCIEAIITDNQFRRNPDLAQLLYDKGFRLKTRFHNNTGGMCNILHRTSGERDPARARHPWVQLLRQP